MTYKLNGINYTEMLLTDEELAVVKAMRDGAEIAVYFQNLQELDEVDERMEIFKQWKPENKNYSWIKENSTLIGDYITFHKGIKDISVACFLDIKKD